MVERMWLVVGALALVYALPLLFPPALVPPEPLSADASVLARLFPGVPAWWVVSRLAALAAASAIAGTQLSFPPRRKQTPPPRGKRPGVLGWTAAATAVATLAAAPFAAWFSRSHQWWFVAALAAPPLLFAVAEGRLRSLPGAIRRAVSEHRGVLLVVLVWLTWRLPAAWSSWRPADAVDTWHCFDVLEATTRPGFNLIADRALQGVSPLHLILQGAGVFGGCLPVEPRWLQMVDGVHAAATAVALGAVAHRIAGAAAAAVAAAALLFSPLALLAPLTSCPIFIAPLLASLMCWFGVRWRESGSAAHFTSLVLCAGLGATHPIIAPFSLLALVTAAVLVWRGWRLRAAPAIAAAATLLAIALPALPGFETIDRMQRSYTAAGVQWAPLEATMMGQRSVRDAAELRRSRPAGVLVPVGALLAPFAIPRTSARLWGDSLLDPTGAVLLAFAAAMAIASSRHSAVARLLLLMLVTAMSPAFVSTYDRPSLTRMATAAVPFALLAAVASERLRSALAKDWLQAAWPKLVVVAIAVGGVALFDVVNPRILLRSSLGLAIESMGGRGDHAVFLERHNRSRFSWLRVATIATAFPKPAMGVFRLPRDGSVEALEASDVRLVFWNAGLEQDENISAAICRLWPGAAIVELRSANGASRALAADRSGGDWRPRLPNRRYASTSCG